MNQEIFVQDLPRGWEMKIDPRTNRPFFIDHISRTTSWTDPRETKKPSTSSSMYPNIQGLQQGPTDTFSSQPGLYPPQNFQSVPYPLNTNDYIPEQRFGPSENMKIKDSENSIYGKIDQKQGQMPSNMQGTAASQYRQFSDNRVPMSTSQSSQEYYGGPNKSVQNVQLNFPQQYYNIQQNGNMPPLPSQMMAPHPGQMQPPNIPQQFGNPGMQNNMSPSRQPMQTNMNNPSSTGYPMTPYGVGQFSSSQMTTSNVPPPNVSQGQQHVSTSGMLTSGQPLTTNRVPSSSVVAQPMSASNMYGPTVSGSMSSQQISTGSVSLSSSSGTPASIYGQAMLSGQMSSQDAQAVNSTHQLSRQPVSGGVRTYSGPGTGNNMVSSPGQTMTRNMLDQPATSSSMASSMNTIPQSPSQSVPYSSGQSMTQNSMLQQPFTPNNFPQSLPQSMSMPQGQGINVNSSTISPGFPSSSQSPSNRDTQPTGISNPYSLSQTVSTNSASLPAQSNIATAANHPSPTTYPVGTDDRRSQPSLPAPAPQGFGQGVLPQNNAIPQQFGPQVPVSNAGQQPTAQSHQMHQYQPQSTGANPQQPGGFGNVPQPNNFHAQTDINLQQERPSQNSGLSNGFQEGYRQMKIGNAPNEAATFTGYQQEQQQQQQPTVQGYDQIKQPSSQTFPQPSGNPPTSFSGPGPNMIQNGSSFPQQPPYPTNPGQLGFSSKDSPKYNAQSYDKNPGNMSYNNQQLSHQNNYPNPPSRCSEGYSAPSSSQASSYLCQSSSEMQPGYPVSSIQSQAHPPPPSNQAPGYKIPQPGQAPTYPPSSSSQAPGCPPSSSTQMQGYPPQSLSHLPSQAQSYPPPSSMQPHGYPPQSQGFPPQLPNQRPSYPSAQGNPPQSSSQAQGYPQQSPGQTQGNPPQSPGQCPGYPPQVAGQTQGYSTQSPGQTSGNPVQASAQSPGYPAQSSVKTQGYPPQSSTPTQSYTSSPVNAQGYAQPGTQWYPPSQVPNQAGYPQCPTGQGPNYPPQTSPQSASHPQISGISATPNSHPKQNDKVKRARFEMIDRVLCRATEMEARVFGFSGRRGDKEFLGLEEELTRCILDLDKVQTDGIEDIRTARKSAIRRVQHLIDILEERG